jgi:hypothetical protein
MSRFPYRHTKESPMTGYPNEDEGPDEVKWEDAGMTEKPEHTPLPWCIPDGQDNESLVCRDIDGRAGDVIFGTADKFRSWQRRMTIAECDANAALIVRSVNAIPDLVRALESALCQWQMYADMHEREDEGVRLVDEKTAEGDLFRHCKAVLAKVKP